MLLSNIFHNKLNESVDCNKKKDIITHGLYRYATNCELLATKINRVTEQSEIENKTTRKNRVADHL